MKIKYGQLPETHCSTVFGSSQLQQQGQSHVLQNMTVLTNTATAWESCLASFDTIITESRTGSGSPQEQE